MRKPIIACMCLFLTMLDSQPEPLTFHRVDNATYAIHTRYTVAGVNRPQREAYLYQLSFQRHVKEDGIEVDLYLLRKLNMISDATKYSAGTTVGYSLGGQLPVLFDLYKAGNITGVLSPSAIFKQPLLFPVMDNMPNQLNDGVEWNTTISPILLEENLITEIMRDTSAITNLQPEVVNSKVVAHETLDNRSCIRLDSTISIESAHGATAEYKIVTYFDAVDMLPVVNIVEGNGVTLDHKGKRKKFEFYRKEILVSVTLRQKSRKGVSPIITSFCSNCKYSFTEASPDRLKAELRTFHPFIWVRSSGFIRSSSIFTIADHSDWRREEYGIEIRNGK